MITQPQGRIDWRSAGPGVVEITDIFVHPEYRRQGHGRRLLELALKEIGQVRTVYLFTELGNTGAHRFYEACGFRVACRLAGFYSYDGALLYIRRDGDFYLAAGYISGLVIGRYG